MKIKKVFFVILVSLFCLVLNVYSSDVHETFQNIPAANSSYTTRTWTGDDGEEWNATDARTDQTLDGKAILIRNGVLTLPTFHNGIDSLTLSTQRVFGGGSGDLTVKINGNDVGVIPYSDQVQTNTVSDINIIGEVNIEIHTPGNGDRIVMDNLLITFIQLDPSIPSLPQIKAPTTNTNRYDTNIYEPITIAGEAENAQNISLYVNGIFADSEILGDSTFSFTINTGGDTGLKLNDTTLIQIISDSESVFSDTAYITIFVDQVAPVMTEDILLTEHEYDITNIVFNEFFDSTGISYYNIYIDTDNTFSNYIFDTATTNEYTPGVELSIDTWFIKITAVDNAGNISDTYYDTFTVVPFDVTIASVRNQGEGATVTAKGIMTVNQNTVGSEFYIQDATAGISVYGVPSGFNGVAGDEILLTGNLNIFNGLLQIANPTSVEVLTSGNNIPEPIVLTTAQASNADDKEGMLIRINNVEVITGTISSSGGDNLTINDGSGDFTLRVDNRTGIGGQETPTGRFDIIGILSRYNDLQIKPRSWEDFIFAPDSTPIILQPTSSLYYLTVNRTVTLSGTARQGDTIIFYVDNIQQDILPAISSSNWEWILNQSNGLKLNDTVLVEVVASDSEGNFSDTANINIEQTDEIINVETFDNLTAAGSYVDGTFEGQDGSTWTYVQCRGDFEIDGKAIMIGRSRTPQSYFESGNIPTGIGILNFDYKQAYPTNVNLNVLINDEVVANVTTSGEEGIVKNSGEIEINNFDDIVIKFINVNNGDGQVVIDNVSWTSFSDIYPPKPVIIEPVSEITTYCTSVQAFDISGTLRAGDTFYLYKNGNLEVQTPNSNGIWDYQLNNLPIDDTILVELVASDTDSYFSDTTIFNIFVDITSPELTGDLLSDTEFGGIRPLIRFAEFNDNYGINYYNIYYDTLIDFSNAKYDTSLTNFFRPSEDLTEEDTWYIKITAVDFASNISDTYYDTFHIVPLKAVPIADVKEVNQQGVPLLLGNEVMIEGIVTVGTNRISTEWNQVFVQDATGGICILERNAPTITFNEGDSIILTGILGHYNGLTTIEDFQVDTIVAQGQPLPEPVILTISQLANMGENWEGQLIKLDNVRIESGDWPGSGREANLTITDGSDNTRLRIESVTDIPGQIRISSIFSVSGVLSQYKTSTPWTSGYQIVPKEYADFIPDTDVLDFYYNFANGKVGEELFETLNDIIKEGHYKISYDAVWDAYYYTDVRDGNKVWDIYSDYGDGQGGAYEYIIGVDQATGGGSGEGVAYNREHSFPQSWWGGSTSIHAHTDLFHVYPTDQYVNGIRSNYPYGIVDNPTRVFSNGAKFGSNTYPGYSGTAYEPIDAYKGDLARTYFYMSARYHGEDDNWEERAMFDGAKLKPWAIKMLLEWHINDPVSQKEIDRNNAVYIIQGNRNPFIDNPEFVHYIWGYPAYSLAHNVASDTTIILNDYELNIPADVISDSTYLYMNIEEIFELPQSPQGYIEITKKMLDITFENRSTKNLDKNVEIILNYDTAAFFFGESEDSITVYYYDIDTDTYINLSSDSYIIDKINKTINISINFIAPIGIFVPATTMPIADIRVVDNDDIAVYTGQLVSVEGLITYIDGYSIYIQEDTSAGIVIFEQDNFPYEVGDKIRVKGTIGQYNKLVQLQSCVYSIISYDNPLPEPLALTANDILTNGGLYEGMLVRINNVNVVGGSFPLSSSAVNVYVNDGSNDNDLLLRIDSFFGKATPENEFDVIGVLSRFHDFQVKPRSYEDIILETDHGEFVISTSSPYTLELDNIELNFPANVVNENELTISIKENFQSGIISDTGVTVSSYFDISIISPFVIRLNDSVTVHIKYKPDQFPLNANEDNLTLYTYDSEYDIYTPISRDKYSINKTTKHITFETDRFYNYVVGLEIPVNDIIDIRLYESDGETAKLLGQNVIVEGVVTHITGASGREIYLQDETAGIVIDDASFPHNIGDRIRVRGTIGQYRNLIQLQNSQYTLINSDNELPEPIVLTTYDINNNGIRYEGMLVMIRRVTRAGGNIPTSEAGNIYINDGSEGNNDLEVRIDVSDIYGMSNPAGRFTVIGVIGRFWNAFQLKPRSREDFLGSEVLAEIEIARDSEASIVSDDLNLNIPSDAIMEDTAVIKVEELFDNYPDMPARYRPASIVANFKVNDNDTYIFNRNISITLKYDMSLFPVGTKISDVKPFYYTESSNGYIEIASDKYEFDTRARSVKITTNHFSIYTLLISAEDPISIAEAKMDLDNDGEPDLINRYAMVEGIVTAGPNIYGSNDIYIQDESAGININVNSFDSDVVAGSQISVMGKIGYLNGLVRLTEADILVLDTDVAIPDPVRINVYDYENKSYQYQSMLVEMIFDNKLSDTINYDDTIIKLSQSGNEFDVMFHRLNNQLTITPNDLEDTNAIIRGILFHDYRVNWRISPTKYFVMPRDDDDLVALSGLIPGEIGINIINRTFAPVLNESLDIEYSARDNQILEIKVFNVQGRYVKTVYSGTVSGSGIISWDGKNNTGRISNVGIYILYIDFDGRKIVKPISVAVPMN